MIDYLIKELKVLMRTHNNDTLTYRGLLDLLCCVKEQMERDENDHERFLSSLDGEFLNTNL